MILTPEQISFIEAKAEDILAEVYNSEKITPPIDLGKIAQKFNVSLQKVKFKEPDAIGQFDRSKNAIYVTNGEFLPRMSFTIAHELGHFILHKEKLKETFWRFDFLNLDIQDKKEEAEANVFAASLLMPKNLVFSWWNKTKDVSVLASVFGVSQLAMQYRLKNLDLLEKN